MAKMTFKSILIVVILIGVLACNNSQKQTDTKKLAQEHNDAKFDYTDHAKQDAEFIVDATERNLAEIILGQLAQQKSILTDVKELGKMLEKAHTQSMKDLMVLAKKKLITIPTSATEDSKTVYKKLSQKSGKMFDKGYCDMMINTHKDAIAACEKESKESNDTEIINWAKETLPMLRIHLDHAITCKKECEKME